MPASSPDPATGSSTTTGAGPTTGSSPTRSSGPSTAGRPGPTEGSGPTAGANRAGAGPRVITAATGSGLHCRGWPQEAAWRMLHNNLDPAVAERPEDLVVYGGGGKAARDWPSFDAISRTLLELGGDETLLVQSGRPVGVLQTHEWAPRVLIANSNLVGEWDNWDEFRRLEQLGLTMYGQMTAGSWIYIGTQGILQGTYETFAAIADRRFHAVAGGHAHDHRRRRRHGRRPAPRRHHERRGGHLRRRRPHPPATAARDPLLRRDRPEHRRGHPTGPPSPIRPHGPVDRGGRQRRRAARALRRAQRSGRHRHRPDSRPRPDDVRPAPPLGGRGRRPAAGRSAGVSEASPRLHRPPRDGHAGPARSRRRGVRLRQQPAGRGPPGRRRPGLRLSRLRPRLHPAAVLRGQGSVSLGGPVRRSRQISAPPTGPCSRSSPTTNRWLGGSAWRPTGWRSRACPPGSAGSAWASGPGWVPGSTTWWRPVSSGHRS